MTTQTNEQGSTRPSSRHEARDVAQASRRMIRALVKRSSTGDTEALRELVETQRFLAQAIQDAGAAAYATGHYSYSDLAGELGISRQAARQRFAPTVAANDKAWAEGPGQHALSITDQGEADR